MPPLSKVTVLILDDNPLVLIDATDSGVFEGSKKLVKCFAGIFLISLRVQTEIHTGQKELFLVSTSREPSSLGQLDPLIGPKWPSAEHGRFSTEANIDCPAKKEWQSPVKHPRRKCWSAYIANGGIP